MAPIRRWMLLGLAGLLLALPAPALADEDEETPAAPSVGQLQGLEKQLGAQERQTGDPSLGKLMGTVAKLKNGGKGVTAQEIGELRGYLDKMGAESSNPEVGMAMQMLGQQLDAMQHQLANPDEDPMKAYGLDN